MTTETTNWPDLAIGLYERLTGRQAESLTSYRTLSCKFQAP